MYRILCLLVFNYIGISFEKTVDADDNYTLVLLHVLFRHGDRTADSWYGFETDLHKNETYFPIGFGQLTKKGKQTSYNIGKYLRKRYDDFLPKQYTPQVVQARSSNFKRTKMTLQLVLASLFPPGDTERFKDDLNWQPIPYIYEAVPDVLHIAHIHCVNWILKYYNNLLSEAAQQILSEHKPFYEELAKVTGNKVSVPTDVAKIYFTLKSQYDWGLKLPAWAESIFPKKLEEETALEYELATATPDLKKLSAGYLLKKILEDTEAKIDGTLPNDQKIFLYSAHEFNIATMLRLLDIYYPHVPPFGATLLFEVYKVKESFGIKIYYQDYTSKEPKLLTIPSCSEICMINRFHEIFRDYLPGKTDYCTINFEL